MISAPFSNSMIFPGHKYIFYRFLVFHNLSIMLETLHLCNFKNALDLNQSDTSTHQGNVEGVLKAETCSHCKDRVQTGKHSSK